MSYLDKYFYFICNLTTSKLKFTTSLKKDVVKDAKNFKNNNYNYTEWNGSVFTHVCWVRKLDMLFLSGRSSTKKSLKQICWIRYQGTLFPLKRCIFCDIIVHCVHLRWEQSIVQWMSNYFNYISCCSSSHTQSYK